MMHGPTADREALTSQVDVHAGHQVAWRPVVRDRHRNRDFTLRRALLVADMLGLWLSLAGAMLLGGRPEAFAQSLWIVLILPLWAFLFWSYRLYRRSIRSFEPAHIDDIPSLFHALLIGTLGMWIYFRFLAPVPHLDLTEVIIFGILALPLIAMLRSALRTINLRQSGPEKVFVVAPPSDVRILRRKFENHPEYEMALYGAIVDTADDSTSLGLSVAASLDEVDAVIEAGGVDHLIVRLDAEFIPQHRIVEIMRLCHREGIRFSSFPGVSGLIPPGLEVNHLEGTGMLTSNPPVLSRSANIVKRGLDIIVSVLALTLLAPLMALIAIGIKVDSKGPVVYRQKRVGKRNRRFRLAKFRTMDDGADRHTAKLMEKSLDSNWLLIAEDPRVTRFGRILRASSLDELPQLWNVLKGEMSLVGPRPLPECDDQNVSGWHRHRLDLSPGLTGYWQVLGRTTIPFGEMLEIDYAYVASWSLWHDLRLLVRTIPVVLRRRGAN